MRRRFEAQHPEPRFWAVSVEGDVVTITTGPVHSPGTARDIACASPEAALKAAEQLVAARLRDGFVEAHDGENGAARSPLAAASLETERALLADDPAAWLVFADQLLEHGDRVRGELIGWHVRAAKRERGSIGQAKQFVRDHFDDLVGSEVAAFHKQVTFEWRFGYARTVRVWSSPHSVPLSDVVPAVLRSPACRFLERLEFGSPGAEGKYDVVLRTLAKLPWPAHLSALFLGNFDVEAARVNESAWPRLESVAALQPVADRVRALDVRATFNTFGKALRFGSLERLALLPTTLEGRLVPDLLTLEAPKLREFGLTADAPPAPGWEAWARLIRQWLLTGPLDRLEFVQLSRVTELLEALGEELLRVQRVDLTGALSVSQAKALARLSTLLSHAEVVVSDEAAIVRALENHYPRLVSASTVTRPKAPKALPKRRRRRDDLDYYE